MQNYFRRESKLKLAKLCRDESWEDMSVAFLNAAKERDRMRWIFTEHHRNVHCKVNVVTA